MEDSCDAVRGAITRRIGLTEHGQGLIAKYGLPAVREAIDVQASSYEGTSLEEIGTSDVSIWVHNVELFLQRNHTVIEVACG